MGVAKIFTPGAATHEIVDWVKSALGSRDSGVPTAPGG